MAPPSLFQAPFPKLIYCDEFKVNNLCNYLITPEERLKVYFPSYLETKISARTAHILSSFPASFQRFWLKFGENVSR